MKSTLKKKEVKKTTGQKVGEYIEKRKVAFIIAFAVILIGLIGYIVFDIINSKNTEKDLGEIEYISYQLTSDSVELDEAALAERGAKAIEALTPYFNKSGIVGIRANLLAAEIVYSQDKYTDALNYWKAASEKNKKAYTYSYAMYRQGVCYEKMNDSSKASDCYKAASEAQDNVLTPHAMFSYGRVLETQGNYQAAYDVYKQIVDTYSIMQSNLSPFLFNSTYTDEWANVAKSRMLKLEIDGKAKTADSVESSDKAESKTE